MTKAFRTAEMISYLLLGEGRPQEYPRSILLDEERLRRLRKSVDKHSCALVAKLYDE